MRHNSEVSVWIVEVVVVVIVLVVWKVLLDADSTSGLKDIPSGSVGVAVAAAASGSLLSSI